MSVIDLLASSSGTFLATSFIVGLLVGSFLNVVIHRMPILLDRQWRAQCTELAGSEPGAAAVCALPAEPASGAPAAAMPQGVELASGDPGATKVAALPGELANRDPDSMAAWAEPANGEPAAAAMRAAVEPANREPATATAPAQPDEPFNLMVPRSACPSCKAPITALQNIPIISWLVLGGRCANCGTSISARYPLVEALTGLLTVAVAWKFGFGWPALAAMVLTWFLVALSFIDVDHQLLPDDLTLPLLWLGLALSLWGAVGGPAGPTADLRSSVIGAMAGYTSLWSLYHLFRLATGKEGMGFGDFKLFGALGAWLGWQMLFPIILLAAVAGTLIGLLMLTLRGKDRATPIPFGPFLAAAGWLVMMWGRPLVAAYLGLGANS